jgi:hypothetical protein
VSRFAFALVGAILPIGNHTISEYLRSGSYAREEIQTVTVTLGGPVDRNGEPVKIYRGSERQPDYEGHRQMTLEVTIH